MRQRIRRYAAVGIVATVVDMTVFLVAHAALDQLVGADILALAVAALTSAVLHRWVTLRNDPYVRWVQRLQFFIPVVIVAGAVDLVVLLALSRSGHRVFWPKLAAVGLAACVRIAAHRSLLFRVVRREQDAPSNRPIAAGAVRLSVVVPAYREQGRIGQTVERLRYDLAAIHDDGGVEIVVVDDGSGDDTAVQARAAGADVVLVQPKNRGKGAAVRAFDPVAHVTARRVLNDRVTFVERPYDALDGADALFVVTEWNEFRHPDFERMKALMKSPVVFDGRNIYSPSKMKELGFICFGVGRK